MTTKVSTPRPIQITPGVQPVTDWTEAATSHFTYTEGIRFVQNLPEKIGGNMLQAFAGGATVSGTIRTIFTEMVNGKFYQILGSNEKLYALIGSSLNDITPSGLTAGALNESAAQGYGAGLYGMGLYGTALVSSNARSYPRIWFVDRFANSFIMTPGNQTGLYQWFGAVVTPPVLITNAPTAINYAFVSNGVIVTFGAGGIENRILSSDFDITVWTSSSTNQVYDDDVEGVGRLTSHCPAQDLNLIFTESETYTFRYIGQPFIWEIKPLDETVGIIAPMARVAVGGIPFWMSQNNFHMYRGGKVETIPANSQNECTALKYVFNDLNWGQKSKIFGWYNPNFNEVWFDYPSAGSNEPDRVIRVNLKDFTWVIDKLSRTAAEWPNVKTKNPYMANASLLYKHELGVNNNGAPLPFTLRGPRMYNGKGNAFLTGVIPDSNQIGNITFSATGYLYPQSKTPLITTTRTITPTTENMQIGSAARYWQYAWSGSELNQIWEMGTWFDDVQEGPTQ